MANISTAALAECKLFMKVDTDADDAVIKLMMAAAIEYLRNAGIAESWSELYKLCVYALTLHYYDHRNDLDTDKVMPAALHAKITQLKMDSFVTGITETGGL